MIVKYIEYIDTNDFIFREMDSSACIITRQIRFSRLRVVRH